MKKLSFLILSVVVLSLLLGGCDELTTVSGKVVDARTDTLSGVSGVSVTFREVEGFEVIGATTSSDGSYVIDYSSSGLYEITAVKDGWFFIPQTVYIGGWLQGIPDLLGIELDSNTSITDDAISFVLTWNSTYKDLDGRLTFPDGDGTGYEGAHSPVSSNAFAQPYASWTTGGGFGPDTDANREHIGGNRASVSLNDVGQVLDILSDSRPAVERERDERDGNGPEVITVRSLPFWPFNYQSLTYGISGNDTNKLPSAVDGFSVNWTWIGVMEYYVDGWDATESDDNTRDADGNLISSTDGSGADGVVYVIQGSTLLGAFSVPEYANIRSANMIRINLFVGDLLGSSNYKSYFQFVPNIRTIDYADIMSVDGAPSNVFGVFGAGR
jgi:hypothetical protein